MTSTDNNNILVMFECSIEYQTDNSVLSRVKAVHSLWTTSIKVMFDGGTLISLSFSLATYHLHKLNIIVYFFQ